MSVVRTSGPRELLDPSPAADPPVGRLIVRSGDLRCNAASDIQAKRRPPSLLSAPILGPIFLALSGPRKLPQSMPVEPFCKPLQIARGSVRGRYIRSPHREDATEGHRYPFHEAG